MTWNAKIFEAADFLITSEIPFYHQAESGQTSSSGNDGGQARKKGVNIAGDLFPSPPFRVSRSNKSSRLVTIACSKPLPPSPRLVYPRKKKKKTCLRRCKSILLPHPGLNHLPYTVPSIPTGTLPSKERNCYRGVLEIKGSAGPCRRLCRLVVRKISNLSIRCEEQHDGRGIVPRKRTVRHGEVMASSIARSPTRKETRQEVVTCVPLGDLISQPGPPWSCNCCDRSKRKKKAFISLANGPCAKERQTSEER